MGNRAGTVEVDVDPSMVGFGEKLARGVSQANISPLSKEMTRIGNKMTASLTLPIALGFGFAFAEAQEAAKVGAQTNAVLESTGQVANVSAREVGGLAERLSEKVAIDDEVIQSGENLLLTFTRVRNETGKGNDVFTQGTKAALDMSVAMRQDLNSSVLLVGKALNDPVKGMTALTRAGVQFTEQQKTQIRTLVESGDILGAQKIILKELATQFGGSAEAAATPFDRLILKGKNFAEEVGTKALPVAEDFFEIIAFGIDLFDSMPDWAQSFVVGGVAVLGATGPVLKFGGALLGVFDRLNAANPEMGAFTSQTARAGARAAVSALAFVAVGSALFEMTGDAQLAGAATGALVGMQFGPWGAAAGGAIGLVAGSLGLLGDETKREREEIRGLASDLEGLRPAAAAARFLAEEVNVAGLSFETLRDSANAGLPLVADSAQVMRDKVRDNFDDMRTDLAQLARESPGAAEAVMRGLRAMGSELPLTAKQWDALDRAVARGTGQYKDNAQAGRDVAARNAEVEASFAGVGGEAQFAADMASEYKTALDNLLGINLSVEEANIGYQQSFADLNASLFENGLTLDINTEAGRANRQAILDSTGAALGMAEAMVRQTGDTAGANFLLQQHAARLTDVMRQAGFTEAEIQSYLTTLGLTPDQITTLVQQVGAEGARGAVDELNAAIVRVPKEVIVTVSAMVGGPNARIGAGGVLEVNFGFGWVPIAAREKGGPVPGLRGEAVPILAHGGEYVLDAETVENIKKGSESAGTSSTARIVPTSGGTADLDEWRKVARDIRDAAAVLADSAPPGVAGAAFANGAW